MPRILVVDDDVDQLRSTCHGLKSELSDWEIVGATTGVEAVHIAEVSPVDVLLTDLELTDPDEGETLLSNIVDSYPSTSRIVISGNPHRALMMRSMGKVHQVLERPCPIDEAATTVLRVYALRKHLNSPDVLRVVNKIDKLPTLPDRFARLSQILGQDDYNQQDIIRLINEDVATSAQLLRIANSSFYARRYPIKAVEQALNLLGTMTVKMVVLSSDLFARCSKSTIREFGLEELWRHSLQVGRYAQLMARKAMLPPEVSEEAFSAGLLHDIGKLVFVQSLPNEYREALKLRKEEGISLHEAEDELFNATHADVGGYVLGMWGMPDSIVEACVYHHHPMACVCRDISVLGLICAANAVDHAKSGSEDSTLSTAEYEEYLHDSGSDEILAAWRDIADSNDEQ
ncbi:MAG: HDOD domain-containing protein [Deltaproteobacteria bacterium]|nr:HDOD domain-containing protein [Deltaproteobacteria bacterium]